MSGQSTSAIRGHTSSVRVTVGLLRTGEHELGGSLFKRADGHGATSGSVD